MSRRGCFGTGRKRGIDEVIAGMREVAPAIPPQPRHFFGQRRYGPAYPEIGSGYGRVGLGPAFADGSYVVGYYEMAAGYGQVEIVAYLIDEPQQQKKGA